MKYPFDVHHFGYRFLDKGSKGEFHPGEDLNGKGEDLGKPIEASASGKILYSGFNSGWGNHILQEVETPFGKRWIHYAHNKENFVQAGAFVNEGTIIASVGETGNAFGPHCHYEIRKNNLSPNFYPYGKDAEFVKANYENPSEFIDRCNKFMVNFKVGYLNDRDDDSSVLDAFRFVNDKLLEFSGGKLGFEVSKFSKQDIFVPNAMVVSDDTVREAIRNSGITENDSQSLICFYNGTMQRPWISTQYIAGTINIPIIKFHKPFVPMPSGLLFEIGHALIQFYNENRDKATMPAISNVDNYDGGEWIVRQKVEQLLPYLSVFQKMATPIPPVVPFKYYFAKDLVYGQRSQDVQALQKALKIDDVFPQNVAETGFYGPTTQNAVRLFQRKYKVASWWELMIVNGRRVGGKTRAKLNELFS